MDQIMEETLFFNSELDIKSELLNIQFVCTHNSAYSIPLYQRLYVWKDDQILTLLEDLERACDDNENNYFLGGIMVTKNPKTNSFDLIDGQQRFTTLWLISQELKNKLSAFSYYLDNKQSKPRITFLIREFANKYFNNPEDYKNFTKDEKAQLEKMENARRYISDFFKNYTEEEKGKYARFVNEKLKFIQTEMPLNIDENRLFEVLNNRGVQLQHHQILKNRLLSKIEDSEKEKYGQLWEACSIMDNYIEKNIKDVGNFKWSELTSNQGTEEKEVELPGDILSRVNAQNKNVESIHLLEVLGLEISPEIKQEDDNFYDSGKVRSIVSFPMLLLHTLRIFLNKKEGDLSINDVEINDKKLLQLFENAFQKQYYNTEHCKEFIELLWQVRVKFDKFVIKWVEIEANEEHHLIKRLYLNKDSLQRREADTISGFELLQSMLYNSQQIITHYWLTPFLNKMLTTDSFNELYLYLKRLDNSMFCGDLSADLKNRSWNHINNDFQNFKLDINELNNNLGTSYRSYWFYKMDFILWHEKLHSHPEWKSFRMTKKNSVEHISPQNPREYDENKLWEDDETLTEEKKKSRLDNFGNLVLLSVGMNSEYSNKTFKEKSVTFREKKRLESLKSDLIFKHDSWDNDKSTTHRDSMIHLFNEYVDKSMSNQK